MRFIFISLILLILSFNSQSQNFKEGVYIDSLGNSIKGFIKLGISNTSFKFRPNPKSKKIQFFSEDVKGLIIGEEKYRVVRDFEAKSGNVVLSTYYASAFGREIQVGKINLFEFKIFVNNGVSFGPSYVYLIQKGDQGKVVQLKFRKKKFREQVKELMQDCEFLKNKYNFDQIEYNQIEEIVAYYNQNFK